MTASRCPGCGANREAVEQTPGSTLWHCPTCGCSREQHDPTLTALDDTFDRRQHPGG